MCNRDQRSHSRTAGAFTVAELLVCIAVLAVLLMVLLPLGGLARSRAARTGCVTNLRQLGAALHLYAAENGGELPPSHVSNLNGTGRERTWFQFMQHRDPSGLSGDGVLPNLNFKTNSATLLTVYNCPANPYRTLAKWNAPSYAYNRALGEDERRVKLVALSTPAHIVMLVDAGYRYDSNVAPEVGPPRVLCGRTSYEGTYAWERSVNFEVHRGFAHFLMADGHVESLDKETVRRRAADNTLLWSRNNLPPGGEGAW